MNVKIIRKKNILNSELLWMVQLLAFFEPAYFSQIHYLDLLFDVMKIASFIFALFLLVKKNRYPIILICSLAYYALIVSLTFFKYGDTKTIILQCISASGAVMILYLMTVYIRDSFIKSTLLVFEVLIYCNCISVLIAPHGLYRFQTITGWWTDACWFLGIRNGMTLTYLIAFYLEWINYYLNKKEKVRFILFIIIASFTVFRINFSSSILIGAGSAGGLVTCWLCILLLFFMPNKIPFLNFMTAFLLDLVFFVLLIFFKIQRLFSFFLEMVLHKSVTLSGRVYLWERSLRVISKHLYFGYGYEYGEDMANRLATPASVTTTQNGFLDVFYNGGIALFIVFLAIILVSAYLIRKHSFNIEVDTLVGYVTFLFFLCCQSESMIGVRFFFYLQLLVLSNAYVQEEFLHEKE